MRRTIFLLLLATLFAHGQTPIWGQSVSQRSTTSTRGSEAVQRALAIADEIDDKYKKGQALLTVATAQLKAGDIEGALRTAERNRDGQTTVAILQQLIGQKDLKLSHLESAERIARKVSGKTKPFGLTVVAIAYLHKREVEPAVTIAESVTDSHLADLIRLDAVSVLATGKLTDHEIAPVHLSRLGVEDARLKGARQR